MRGNRRPGKVGAHTVLGKSNVDHEDVSVFGEATGHWAGLLLGCLSLFSGIANASNDPPAYQIRLDPGHPWRPPFGLDRVGRPVTVVVEATAPEAQSRYRLTAALTGA